MKKRAQTLALSLLLIVLVCVLVFPQVGADKRPPKTSTPKTQPKHTSAPTASDTTSRSKPKQIGLPVEMVLIPAGTFVMGAPSSEEEYNDKERPQHRVSVQSFYMGKYEVTQAQYKAVMGMNSSYFQGCDSCPVEQVTWDDAHEFIKKLNEMQSRYTYRLPSEAEWEYACRAGTKTAFAFGDSLSSEQANFNGFFPFGKAAKGFYAEKTMPVGSFQPNAWGLYDMHGNVHEWCEDVYHNNYNGAPRDGSAWVNGGDSSQRMMRGGSWFDYGASVRSASRFEIAPYSHDSDQGFRLAAVLR